MLPVYLSTFAFGSVLIVASIFFGGADKDFDKDFDMEGDFDGDADLDGDFDGDADLDGDFDGDADLDGDVAPIDIGGALDAEVDGLDKDVSALGDAIWLPIFSMRFWTFGTAAFGFTGTSLHFLIQSTLLVALVALVFGSLTGTAAAYFFKALKKDMVSGETSSKRYAGQEARVVLPIASDRRGKIVVDTAAGHLELVASTRDAEPIPRGATVLIAGVRDGIADVSALGPGDEERRQTARPRALTHT